MHSSRRTAWIAALLPGILVAALAACGAPPAAPAHPPAPGAAFQPAPGNEPAPPVPATGEGSRADGAVPGPAPVPAPGPAAPGTVTSPDTPVSDRDLPAAPAQPPPAVPPLPAAPAQPPPASPPPAAPAQPPPAPPPPVAPPPAPAPAAGPVTFATLLRGSYSGLTEPMARLIPDAAAWASFWGEHASRQVPAPPAPTVDFNQEAVLVVALGERNTGGYTVEVTSLAMEGGRLVVMATSTAPAPGGMVTMAFTQPFHMVRVPRVAASAPLEVRWQGAPPSNVPGSRADR